MRSALRLGLALALLPISACRSSGDAPRTWDFVAEDGDLVLESGSYVGGDVHARTIFVPPDVVVEVTDDLVLAASDWIRVEGELRVIDAARGGEWIDAADLHLRSNGAILVTGAVTGGRGRDLDGVTDPAFLDTKGGNGSRLAFEAAALFLHGQVRSGDGGTGALGGEGGDGGSIDWCEFGDGTDARFASFRSAALVASRSDGERFLRAGDGGTGGPAVREVRDGEGGAGGDGGDSVPFERGEWSFDRRRTLTNP
ncbi:MAG: hypothetical protein R3F34_05625 [Planctomycetota bacterium]